jgi:hypothetical protein
VAQEPDGWGDLLVQLSPEVAALVTAADAVVRRTDPDVVRVVWPHQKTVGYGVGPKKMSEHYAYLAVHPGTSTSAATTARTSTTAACSRGRGRTCAG